MGTRTMAGPRSTTTRGPLDTFVTPSVLWSDENISTILASTDIPLSLYETREATVSPDASHGETANNSTSNSSSSNSLLSMSHKVATAEDVLTFNSEAPQHAAATTLLLLNQTTNITSMDQEDLDYLNNPNGSLGSNYSDYDLSLDDLLYRHSINTGTLLCLSYVVVFILGLVGNCFVIAVVFR